MPVGMTTRQTRNVSLTPELETFIAERLSSGDYGNASEVVRSALKLLRDQGERPKSRLSAGWPQGGR
jgi:putative addiction module CopG family antidote